MAEFATTADYGGNARHREREVFPTFCGQADPGLDHSHCGPLGATGHSCSDTGVAYAMHTQSVTHHAISQHPRIATADRPLPPASAVGAKVNTGEATGADGVAATSRV